MANEITRKEEREAFFLNSTLRLASGLYRVNIRNLSPGGALIEPVEGAVVGEPAAIEVRNIGWVEGAVAWAADNRVGLRFKHSILLSEVRGPIGGAAPNADLRISGESKSSPEPTNFTLFYVVRWMKGHTTISEKKFEHLMDAKAHAEARLHLNRIRKGATAAEICDLDGVTYFRIG